MHYTVKILRNRGTRRPERDIQADPGTPGQINGAHIGSTFELKLHSGDSRMEPLIPVLTDARLVSMHGDKMLFKGTERDAGGAGWVQEWSVRVGG